MKKILLFAGFIVAFIGALVFSYPIETYAGQEHNVSGWAWSNMERDQSDPNGKHDPTIGWISFNSKNCDANDDRLSDGNPPGCPSAGTPIANYGVKVASNGEMSGYAWSENIGWISFNSEDVSGCPAAPCAPKLDRTTGQVSGWARACAGTVNGDCKSDTRTDGWDGWIHLRGTAQNGSTYGVSVSGCDWDGWAWGSDVVGWIHFKGANYGVVGTGDACTNRPPSATSLQVQQSDYCSPNPGLFFSWTFNDPGDSQSAYQVQIYNDSGFSSLVYDSFKRQSTSNVYSIPIIYGGTYYWQLKVWDSKDSASGWIQAPSSFNTPSHAYPTVDFSWTPLNPTAGEKVKFTDKSTVYGGSTKQKWEWNFIPDGNPPKSSAREPDEIKFQSEGNKKVTLTVTDSDGFACTAEKIIRMGKPLPEWKEITPF